LWEKTVYGAGGTRSPTAAMLAKIKTGDTLRAEGGTITLEGLSQTLGAGNICWRETRRGKCSERGNGVVGTKNPIKGKPKALRKNKKKKKKKCGDKGASNQTFQ